jgi:hypothetical protein
MSIAEKEFCLRSRKQAEKYFDNHFLEKLQIICVFFVFSKKICCYSVDFTQYLRSGRIFSNFSATLAGKL